MNTYMNYGDIIENLTESVLWKNLNLNNTKSSRPIYAQTSLASTTVCVYPVLVMCISRFGGTSWRAKSMGFSTVTELG